ncbi:MAG: peptidoglycan bridge formation glycyltransferase FemA/FemB family protein [Patescibacteria group bacterium]
MLHLKEISEEGEWEAVTKDFEMLLTQTFVYGEIQKKMGRTVKMFSILEDGKNIGAMLLIAFPLFGKLKYWYAPYGPILSAVSKEILVSLKKELKKKINTGSVFVRLDFTLDNRESGVEIQNYFTKATASSYHGAYFQPRAEWYTKINKTPEEILGSMHSKTRYSVRLAEKKGVTINIVTKELSQKLPDFLRLMKQTAKRNGFSIHNDSYYNNYFELVEKTGKGFLIEGVYGGEVLASHFIFLVGNVAHYVFGASSDAHKDLCAPYLVHYRAMIEAKTMGAEYYNFGAVSVGKNDKEWQGLTTFKQKFGGELKVHGQLYDLVLMPFWYYIYIIRKVIKTYL